MSEENENQNSDLMDSSKFDSRVNDMLIRIVTLSKTIHYMEEMDDTDLKQDMLDNLENEIDYLINNSATFMLWRQNNG